MEEEKNERVPEQEDSETNEEEQEYDVDIMEISLGEDEIDNWITELENLKETKQPITLEIDNENELQINFEEGEEDDTS